MLLEILQNLQENRTPYRTEHLRWLRLDFNAFQYTTFSNILKTYWMNIFKKLQTSLYCVKYNELSIKGDRLDSLSIIFIDNVFQNNCNRHLVIPLTYKVPHCTGHKLDTIKGIWKRFVNNLDLHLNRLSFQGTESGLSENLIWEKLFPRICIPTI